MTRVVQIAIAFSVGSEWARADIEPWPMTFAALAAVAFFEALERADRARERANSAKNLDLRNVFRP